MAVRDLGVAEAEPYKEQFYELVPNVGIANGVYTNFTFGSFLMPWAGTAIGEFYAQYVHGGHQHVQFGLAASSPGPNNFQETAKMGQNDGNTWAELPTLARWVNLVANQTITIVGRVYAGGGSGASVIRLWGSIRAYRSDP